MSNKGTAGLGLVSAGALIVFAVLNPGSPTPRPDLASLTGASSTAQRAAYGAALGGQTASASLTGLPSQEELDQLIAEYLEDATADAKRKLDELLPQYLAGASASAQAQLSSLARQYLDGIPREQILAGLGTSRGGQVAPDNADAIGRLIAPYVNDALGQAFGQSSPRGGTAGSGSSLPNSGAPGSSFMDDGDLKASLDRMASELDALGFDSGM